MGGTSVEYLTSRLQRIGRTDLLAAVERGEISAYAAAEAAGLVTRRPVQGGGSVNQTRRRHYALLRATGQAPPLEPPPEPAPPRPEFSPQTRAVIARLVEAGRTHLVLAVTERRISPSAAARIADRSMRRRAVFEDHKVEEAPKPKKPPPFDPTVLIP